MNTLRVTGSVVNMRNGPSTNSKVLRQVRAGDIVQEVPATSLPWRQVKTADGTVGWIHGAYLTESAAPQPVRPASKPKWRVARSLDVLLAQLNERAPKRSKKYDGSIGDTAHSARKSDHNPAKPPATEKDQTPVVRARDYTHDPSKGADMEKISEAIRASKDKRVCYLIFNGRICKSYVDGKGNPAWQWQKYTGANDHAHHLHVSVVANPPLYDNVSRWSI